MTRPFTRRGAHALAAICLAATTLIPALAAAQRAPQTPVGNTSNQGGRLDDLLAAHRCMDFAVTFGKGYLAADLARNPRVPSKIASTFDVKDGKKKTLRDPSWVGLPTNAKNRPSGWKASQIFGEDVNGKNFRADLFRRYGSPKGANPGTYNLTFVVMSDADQVFVCIQGTEPEIFPFGKPKGNTMNNLNAKPTVMKRFDPKARVHAGWAQVAHHYHGLLVPILRSHGVAKKKLTITGHSQGGVMAGYIGFLLAKNGDMPRNARNRIVTFSAPRYGTPQFIRRFRKVLEKNAPMTTVDALETEGDLVPGFWPLGQIPTGRLWRANPRDVGYKDVHALNAGGHHGLGISGFHARKIIDTKGAYRGPAAVIDTVDSTVSSTLAATCPRGYEKTATQCVSLKCPSGLVRKGGACVSSCPANTKRSATGAHCMTKTTPFKKSTKKVWVGNFKKPRKYRRACPAGTSFSHDLAGYSYCTSGSCPAHLPVRKGGTCHASCGPLATDPFGNCVVQSQPRETMAHQCPAGTRRKGPVCVK